MEDDDYDQDEGEKRRNVKEMWGGEPLGLNSNIRVYRYKTGQFFAQHCEYSLVSQERVGAGS